jgi:hypothetical protein
MGTGGGANQRLVDTGGIQGIANNNWIGTVDKSQNLTMAQQKRLGFARKAKSDEEQKELAALGTSIDNANQLSLQLMYGF